MDKRLASAKRGPKHRPQVQFHITVKYKNQDSEPTILSLGNWSCEMKAKHFSRNIQMPYFSMWKNFKVWTSFLGAWGKICEWGPCPPSVLARAVAREEEGEEEEGEEERFIGLVSHLVPQWINHLWHFLCDSCEVWPLALFVLFLQCILNVFILVLVH